MWKKIGIALFGVIILSGLFYLFVKPNRPDYAPGPDTISESKKINEVTEPEMNKNRDAPALMSESEKIYNLGIEIMDNIDKENVNHSTESQKAIHKNVDELCTLASQGSQEAIIELVDTSYELNDNIVLHQILRALVMSGAPEGINALLDAIGRNLDKPIEVLRMCSYLPKTSGMLDESVTDRLYEFSQTDGIDPQTKKNLIMKINNDGGYYGRDKVGEQLIEVMRPELKSGQAD